MNLNLGSRVPNALPYVVIALGFAFFASPFVSFLEPSGLLNFVNAGYPYVIAGVFVWFAVRGKVEKTLYVLAVPAVTFLALTGTWLYFESPSPYEPSMDGVFLFGAVSLFFVLGYTAKKREWAYIVGSVIAYFACVFVVVSSSLRLDLLRMDLQNPLPIALELLYIVGPGIPLAVVAYFVLGGNPNKRKRAYLATSLLAYVVWIVILPISGSLNLLSLVFALPIVLGLGIPSVVVPYLLSEGDSKSREWTYLGVSLLFYVVWVFAFDVVVPLLFASFEGYFVLALTLGAGTPLALVAYSRSGEDRSE